MRRFWVAMGLGFLFGAAVVLLGQWLMNRSQTTSAAVAANEPRRILVPFMHMRGFGGKAGHHAKSGESQVGAGTEIEIWNVDDKRPLTITEIYFTAPDGTTRLEGSKYGLPLPLELKPHTHYHFSSFYEHVKLPVPPMTEGRKNFIHGYLADIRWSGPAPRVRGWDKGVKDGEYFLVTPVAVFEDN
ncbi:MAG TPA: hypothetical protein VNO70_04170 [Blastocatellia bacterium]|nr:hypothetical protein [Blastocatellia bacterium]